MKAKSIVSFVTALGIVSSSMTYIPAAAEENIAVSAESVSENADENININTIDTAVPDEGKSVELPDELVSYKYANSNYQLVYNNAQNGIYFVSMESSEQKINFLSLEDSSYETVLDVSKELDLDSLVTEKYSNKYFTVKSTFVQGNTLYIMGTASFSKYTYVDGSWESQSESKLLLITYDFDRKKATSLKSFDGEEGANYKTIGVDASGRFYVSYSKNVETTNEDGETTTENKNYLALYSPEFKLLDTAELLEPMYHFTAFDENTGLFYFETYFNWVYWGYPHDMHALAMGKVEDNKLTIEKNLVQTLGQNYYSTLNHHGDLVGGKYLCVDAPLNATGNLMNPYSSGLSIYDSAAMETGSPWRRNVTRSYPRTEDGSIDSKGVFGSRTVASLTSADDVITVKGDKTICEINVETGKMLGFIETEHPVFALIRSDDSVLAITRDKDEEGAVKFYLQVLKWEIGTKLAMSKSEAEMESNASGQLKIKSNGTLSELVTWSSSDPTVASVNENGKVYAIHPGKAVIKAETERGLTCECEVTVKPSDAYNAAGSKVTTSGVKSKNIVSGEWGYSASPLTSYIAQNEDNTIMRVELVDDYVVLENYSADTKKLKNAKRIKKELPVFGGAYIGKDYNFLVFGQENREQDDEREVVRIVKYNKNWTRLAELSVGGANTYIPFDGGSLRMTELDGTLYIHTCHEMYAEEEDEGVHHQANMTFVVDEEEMTMKQSMTDVLNLAQAGYVSHSFNQFIRTDGKYIYRVDHGDANPRAISITLSNVGGDITDIGYILPFKISGGYGANYTGVTVGGFELSTNNMLVLGSSVDQENFSKSIQRNIFLTVTKKDYGDDNDPTKTIWLTEYSEEEGIEICAPKLVKLNDDSFMVMWRESQNGKNRTMIATVDGRGNLTSKIVSTNYYLSDCQPELCADGLVRWYATNNSSPVFYAINPFNFTKLRSGIRGDADGDGTINMKDYAVLQRALNGWDDVSVEKDVADVNSDGKVNMKDLAYLHKLINGNNE